VPGTFFAILDYARKCGMRAPETTLSALTITADRGETETPQFRPDDAARIIAGAKEPYRTIFALAWCTGLRAGELLGLSRSDLDFERKLIVPRKQADDSTRQLRELKTKKSKSPVAMTREVEAMLGNYLRNVWQENSSGLLFPNRNGRPRKRQYVVKFGLKPLLRKLGLPAKDVGCMHSGMG
jgi:integrase